jgi:serine/threonine-protein kinase ULK4
VAQHYAVKTIENICSQGSEWAARFATQDVVVNLVAIFSATGGAAATGASAQCNSAAQGGQASAGAGTASNAASGSGTAGAGAGASGKSENLRATAASTLARLLRGSPQLLAFLLERYGVKLLVTGVSDPSSKVVHSLVQELWGGNVWGSRGSQCCAPDQTLC